jgi:hypothetical protein
VGVAGSPVGDLDGSSKSLPLNDSAFVAQATEQTETSSGKQTGSETNFHFASLRNVDSIQGQVSGAIQVH